MPDKRYEFKANEDLVNDFKISAGLEHMDWQSYLRTLMVKAVKQAFRANPAAFNELKR